MLQCFLMTLLPQRLFELTPLPFTGEVDFLSVAPATVRKSGEGICLDVFPSPLPLSRKRERGKAIRLRKKSIFLLNERRYSNARMNVKGLIPKMMQIK